jgi:hypothetical protein
MMTSIFIQYELTVMWFVQMMPKFSIFLLMVYPHINTPKMDTGITLIIMDRKGYQSIGINNEDIYGKDPSYKDSG